MDAWNRMHVIYLDTGVRGKTKACIVPYLPNVNCSFASDVCNGLVVDYISDYHVCQIITQPNNYMEFPSNLCIPVEFNRLSGQK